MRLAATLAWVVAAIASRAGASHAAPGPGQLATVEMAPQPHAQTAGVLFLNRCAGGCTITKGAINDAKSNISQIPDGPGTEFTVSEFAWGDDEWNAILHCVREVYSPYAVEVVDVEPTGGIAYNEAIVAGSDHEIGVNAGGIAPVTSDCSPYSFVISFTFANQFGPGGRVNRLCAVAAQESGHSFGLDHTYAFLDGSSGCRDPMSYRGDCGGQKFFRNDLAICGEFSARQSCRCGTTQKSHLKLLTVLGAGTPITRPPEVTVKQPADGAAIASGQVVIATASAQRGIRTVELWLNGYLWGSALGAKWGANGQPEADYGIALPAEVPDGIIDVVIKAKDDIDVTTTAPTITVTKGAPCTSAETCANGQRCDAGRCLWDPPAGEVGEACTYPQFCKSGQCQGTADQQICTQACVLDVTDSCPGELACVEASPGQGICYFGTDACEGGCCGCSLVAADQPAWLHAGLSLGLLGLIVLRPRRRRHRR